MWALPAWAGGGRTVRREFRPGRLGKPKTTVAKLGPFMALLGRESGAFFSSDLMHLKYSTYPRNTARNSVCEGNWD